MTLVTLVTVVTKINSRINDVISVTSMWYVCARVRAQVIARTRAPESPSDSGYTFEIVAVSCLAYW